MILNKVAMIVKLFKDFCNGINEQFKKRKIIIVGDSLLNGIHEKVCQRIIVSR